MSLSPGGNGTVKNGNKPAATVKPSTVEKDTTSDKKDQDTNASGSQTLVKKEQRPVVEEDSAVSKAETPDVTETVKEELQKQDVEITETVKSDSSTTAVIKSGDAQGDDGDITDKCKNIYYFLYV